MFTPGRMRGCHLHVFGKLKELLAPCEHSVDVILRDPVVDEVGKTDIPAGDIESLADFAGMLMGSEAKLGMRSSPTSLFPSPKPSKSINGITESRAGIVGRVSEQEHHIAALSRSGTLL